VAILPGATGDRAAELAAFTTPSGFIEGKGILPCMTCTETPAMERVAVRAAPELAATVRVIEEAPVREVTPGETVIQLGMLETVQEQEAVV
jgi:hypothetical protein